VGCSQTIKSRADGLEGEVRPIAVAAEVTQIKLAEIGGHDFGGEFSCGIV
jgi:hypothetical protein